MAYSVEIPDHVKAYLRDLVGYSREGRIKIFSGIHSAIALLPDAFFADPDNRVSTDPPLVVVRYLFEDPAGSGRYRAMRFFVNDSKAEYGVLRIVSMLTTSR